MKLKKLIIKGSEWLRKTKRNRPGHIYYGILRVQNTGKKCCLGIMASACGISDGRMTGIGSPASLRVGNPCVDKWRKGRHLGTSTPTAREAMRINDTLLPDDVKIERLRPLFAENGWDLDWRPNE